jgi:hypothetical protein
MNNIEDLFRDADDKLMEMPSGRAWNKLENRLEARVSDRDRERLRLKGQFTRQMSVAAAVLATVLAAGVWATLYILPANTDRLAEGKVTHFEPGMQDVAAAEEVTTLVPIEPTTDNRFTPQADKKAAAPDISTATMSVQPQIPTPAATEKIVVANLPPQAATTSIAPSPIAKADVPAENYTDKNKDGIDDKYAAETKNIASKTAPKAATPAKPSIKTPAKPATESMMNSVTKGQEIVKQAMLTDLKWLLGTWNNKDKTFASMEEWRLDGRFTMYGNTVVVRGKDSTRTETIKIQQEGNLLALYTTIDASGKIYRYELQDREPSKWTFVNTEIAFPQTIVLEQKDRNGFQILMQNGANIRSDKEQFDYLKQRNVILQGQAMRQMAR